MLILLGFNLYAPACWLTVGANRLAVRAVFDCGIDFVELQGPCPTLENRVSQVWRRFWCVATSAILAIPESMSNVFCAPRQNQ
jgi:hypothetical protein